jgi:hypothetical protein
LGHAFFFHASLIGITLLVPVASAAQDVVEPPPPPSVQAAAPAGPDPALGPADRTRWIIDSVIGRRSLGVGVLSAGWHTALNSPEEWHRTASGFGRRYAEREVAIGISNSIEAGLGSLWDEEHRYRLSGRHGLRSRAGYAVRYGVLARRADGHAAPAWGRYAGNVLGNVIQNAWLPPSATTWQQTALRGTDSVLGRIAGNLWFEFWPDVRKRFRR